MLSEKPHTDDSNLCTVRQKKVRIPCYFDLTSIPALINMLEMCCFFFYKDMTFALALPYL